MTDSTQQPGDIEAQTVSDSPPSDEKKPPPSPRKGHVKWFNSDKGFGFITPDDGSDDVFVHQSVIQADGFRSLAEDEAVEFRVETDESGRLRAVGVTGPNGSNVQGAPRKPQASKKQQQQKQQQQQQQLSLQQHQQQQFLQATIAAANNGVSVIMPGGQVFTHPGQVLTPQQQQQLMHQQSMAQFYPQPVVSFGFAPQGFTFAPQYAGAFHPQAFITPPVSTTNTGGAECFQWRDNGKCQFGETCRFQHQSS